MGYQRMHAFRKLGTVVAPIPAPSEPEYRPGRAGDGPLGVVRDLAKHDPLGHHAEAVRAMGRQLAEDPEFLAAFGPTAAFARRPFR